MKILHYTHNLGSGGAEKLLSDILPLMKEKGHEVHLAISNDKLNVAKFQQKLDKVGVAIFNFKTSFYNPFQVIRLVNLLRTQQYDIVHAHLFPTQYWLAFASLLKPKETILIKTEHSVFNERKNYKILRPLEKFVYSRYRKIIGISTQVTENLSRWLKYQNEISTIENGVNLTEIREAGQEAKLKNYPFLLSHNFNVLMVGRFDGEQKDQLSLIRALKYLPKDVHLYFAGEGPYFDTVKKETEVLGFLNQVTFLGLRQDIYTIMNLVNLNILSTNHEGLSGVALESLASGKPFIGADVEGVNNVVPDASYLFPKQNPVALSKKILSIKEDVALQKKMVDKALTHVQAFDISKMVERYLTVYFQSIK